jgi:hypothetical protein
MKIDPPYHQALIEDEEILFQKNQNGFMARENELDQSEEEKAHDPVLAPVKSQKKFSKQDLGYSGASIESETTKEFYPDLFGFQEFNDELNSEKDVSTDESELNIGRDSKK